MRNFFARIPYILGQWMRGRNGMDGLCNAILIAAIVCLLIAIIPVLSFFSWIGLALIIWAVFRCFSKNVTKRQRENERFMRILRAPRNGFRSSKMAYDNRKTTKYFKCPGCGATLSVPRGKGKLRVVCPKCKTETIKKS